MLPRPARLARSRDIQAVYRRRRSFGASCVVVYLRGHGRGEAAELHQSRFGFVVSKKVAKRSHDRNRIKRRMREICRIEILPFLAARPLVDVLLVAKTAAATADSAQLSAEIGLLLRQSGVLGG